MKKLTLIFYFILSTSRLFSQELEEKEVLEYSNLYINNSLSLYAGKVNMEYFDNSDAYCVGFLLQDEEASNVKLAFGYTQPASNFDIFSEKYAEQINLQKDDGILFYINYNF